MRLDLQAWKDTIENYLSANSLGLAIAFGLSALFFMLISLVVWKYAKGMKARFARSLQLTAKFQPENGLEQNLNDLLEQVSEWVDAPTYVFYIYDDNKKAYTLKAVRHRSDGFGKVEPSYSGLVEYKKEQFLPPLSISQAQTPDRIAVDKTGEVKLLSVPIGKQQGLIQIGPIRLKVRKKTVRMLEDFALLVEQVLRQFVSTERLRNQADIILSTGEALQRINNIARDSKVTIDFVLKLAIRVMNASGALFCLNKGDRYECYSSSIGDSLLPEDIPSDQVKDLLAIGSASESIRLITHNDDEYYRMSPQLAALGAAAYAAVDVSERRGAVLERRLLFLWFAVQPSLSDWGRMSESLRVYGSHIQEVLGFQSTLHQFSGTYEQILKTLAQLQDNLLPHTVGYSDLMSRYSIVVAKEMGMNEEEIRDVALAAYLSNIGVMGISADLINKEGKFSEEEFELMKLHSEVGASIVESTLGNKRVASYILHHHERMDGNGYPAGLAGSDIPLGAKIVGAVQTFLAMINGRKNRDPLPFDQAMQNFAKAAGAQLDEAVVNALLAWFRKKQAEPQIHGRSLGVCWEMCCTPSSICNNCPAYGHTEKNCWEFEDNNCAAHGKSCDTCFVKTETMSRKAFVSS